ncbi:nicotinate-nucleotide adenylyltransferase [[Acholeplasma] multilocale]|uniref:nicotinate-nucleotide adenylyltransferase n=1 Tax=[Acholeplasma] multilocale TaxID=264638 RepID=UPI000478B208|nr:nicotinate-nucleotide adenylyltransferase [[Acholeplasma] multilocale]
MAKIALFGGSFDPIHTDHVNIAKACHDKLGFDEVWLIPAYLNPFKKKQNSTILDRLSMLKIVEEQNDFIRINEFEIRNHRPTYTHETVSYILENYQEHQFAFIMGSDQLDSFENWDHFDDLIKMIDFKVFRRSEDINQEVIDKYNLEVFDFENNFLSSTNIRNLIDLNKQIPEINDYVNYNLMYIHERVEKQMEEERYLHCLNVGQMAKMLANSHGEDEEKAFIAGTLHDVTKRWDVDKAVWYLKRYMPVLLEEPTPVWHSFTGYLHLQKDWLMKDPEILQAVFNHTVGSPDMTNLDKIVFCADKVSVERDYPEVEYYRALCFKDLDQGFKELLQMQYDRAVEAHGVDSIGKMLNNTVKYWIKNETE